jgi:hypothetical protein
MLYGTTDKFLRVFGLESLADLPETEALGVAAAQTEGVMVEEADKDQLSIDSAEEVISDAESPAADGEEATL